MNRGLLIALLCGACLACSKSAETPSARPSTVPDGWVIYEDDLFRIAYPPNSDVAGAEGGRQDFSKPTLGIVPPPGAGNSVIGGFFIQIDKSSKGMLLRDGVEADIKETRRARGVVLASAREVAVGNGRCLGTLVITPTQNCAKDAGSCFAPGLRFLCDGPNGARYASWAILSVGPSPDKLSLQAQQEAALYERILRSLEFKKS